MNIAIDNYEEMMLKTILDRVKEEFSEDEDIKVWMDLSAINIKNVEFLKQLLQSIKEKKSIRNATKSIQYTEENNTLKVGANEEKQYEKELMKKMLAIIISAIEPILPLGTVVKLKKETIEHLVKNINDLQEDKQNEEISEKTKITSKDLEALEIMIDKRFLNTNIENKYIEYGGNAYPMSSIDNTTQFMFTNEDISEIKHKGYANYVEKQYVCLVKNELIVNQKKTSIAVKEEGEKNGR